MKDQTKTKKQLIEELEGLRRQGDTLKKAKEAILKGCQEWEHIFQAIGHPTIILDAQHNILSVNSATVKAAGAGSAEELIGRKCYDIFHNTNEPPQGCPLVEMLASTKFEESEMEVEAFGGIFLVSCTPVFDEKGDLQKIIHIATEITERKQAEKALQKSEAHLKLQIERMPIGCIIWDPEFRVVYWNPEAENIFGFTVSDATGKHPNNIIVPRDAQPHVDNIWHRLLQGDATAHSENENITKDGRIITCYWTNTPLKETDGSIIGVLSMVQDITGRKKAEEEILQNEARLRSLVNILQHKFGTIQEFLDYALHEAIHLTGSKIGYIYHYHEDRREFFLNSWSKDVMKECAIVNPQTCYELGKTGIWGEAVRQRIPIVVNDFQASHPLKKGYPQGHAPLYRYLTVPVFNAERIVAVVGVANKETDYAQTDILQLTLLMDSVWKITEHMKIQEELRVLSSKQEAILTSVPDIIMEVDANKVYTWANQAGREFFGEDVIGREAAFYFAGEQKIYDIVQPLFKGNENIIYVQSWQRRKDNENRLLAWWCKVLKDNKGKVTGALSTARDITERKRAEEQIKKLNTELEQRVMERTVQLEAANRELEDEIIERRQREEKIKRQNILLEGINWVVREALTIATEAELCSQTLAIAEELTESRFGFIYELNESGTMDNLVFSDPGWSTSGIQQVDAGIFVKNIPVRGIYADIIEKGLAVIINAPELSPDSVVMSEGYPPLAAFIGIPLKQGEKIIGLIGLANKDSGYTTEDQLMIEMISVAFVEALTRIRSENLIKALNKELEQSIAEVSHANKELEAFSYSVSHDLRAPLRAIDGFAEILLREYSLKLDEEGKRICSVITGNAKKMGQLIDELLSLSRLSRTEMHFTFIDMNELANAVYDELTTPEMRLRTAFEVDDLKKAEGDPILIKQVWVNLISNAIKFSSHRERPVISVTCREEGDRVIYCVKDNGAGFSMQYTGKLFGVFQRLHSEKEFEGTGVGLAIVQRVVHRHGGKVWAQGEVDKGAEFCFSLPK